MSEMESESQEESNEEEIAKEVRERPITDEMKEAYLDYAMSVITSRALPDVRDGLKPVQRRILYSMHNMGLTAGAKFRKSATVVGDVLGNYHPHGDSSVYDALVNMVQDFSFRYPLALGQGNFGSIDGDAPAAYRYTEAKMSKLSESLLEDIAKDTVDFSDNYDGTKEEPDVLPAAVPHLLLNGTLGIAVGMATNIPPHNLSEVVDATIHLVDNPKATTEDLMEFVQGPDFPTGAMIFGEDDIHSAYSNGRGGVLMRGEAEVTGAGSNTPQIIVNSLPYRLNKSRFIEKVADHVKNENIESVKDMRDESTDDIRVVLDLKRGSHPNKVLNQLYNHTRLETKFHFNMVALVDGVPQTLSLKAILEEYIDHRVEVVRRRAEYQLAKKRDREHILLGLQKALDDIDAVIDTIRSSENRDTAQENLIEEFDLSVEQADAILKMRLQRLAGMERMEIEDELEEVQARIEELEELLSDEAHIRQKVKDELEAMEEKHGDERKTRVMEENPEDISAEDMIPNEDSILVYTSGGYVKRTNPKSYKKQKRGGVGVVDLDTKEGDRVATLLATTTHSDLLFFTDQGKVYQIKMYQLPEGRRATRGKSIMNFIELATDEQVTEILAMPKDLKENERLSVAMTTKNGTVKRVDAKNFHKVRSSGIIAISLDDDDELVSAQFVRDDEDILVVSQNGQAIRFNQSDVRQVGRNAQGVRGMELKDDDTVIAADVVPEDEADASLFVLSDNGYGKKTQLAEYNAQKRGGVGVKTFQITDTTGSLVDARILAEGDDEVVVMSTESQAIRIDADEISEQSRNTQGVKVMELKDDDTAASIISL
jgi:DNA gyrase subunit A